MSATRNFLSKRIGVLKADAAANGNEMSRLSKERTRIFAEIAEAEAAYEAAELMATTHEGATS